MSTPRSRPSRRTVLLVLLLLTLVGTIAVVGLWSLRDDPDAPQRTDGPLPQEPGTVLEVEPVAESPLAGSRAWRILYTTTDRDGEPLEATAAVYAPEDSTLTDLPVLVWGHGTSGFARDCSPSLQQDPMAAGSMYVGDEVLRRGWVLVAPDFPGVGADGEQPYLIGEGAGRTMLDAARAARKIEGLSTSPQTAVWGFSQGGHAALWAGGLQPTYAPELELAGVAALAPATFLRETFDRLPAQDRIFAAYTMASYDAAYEDVSWGDYASDEAESFGRELAAECLPDPQAYADLAAEVMSFQDGAIFDRYFADGAMGRRLEENEPELPVPAPLLLAQGSADTVIPAERQMEFATRACTRDQVMEYLTVEGRDHLGLVLEDSPLYPDLFAWTDARLAGEPGPTQCVRGTAGRG
ncbi:MULTISPECIES: lipase family protein [unclassified Aeromicrobium]|uniref:lipase family protein n=1 Tax=unclassified Aeromicrobium TaxID=2633570 RepID=UPI00396B157F